MKTKTKIIIALTMPVLFMLILPLAALSFDGLATMGLWFFAFFTVNPILIVCLSIMAGTELHKLWWIPILIPAVFPLLFSIAIKDLVWDLYYYSAFYFVIGVVVMLITHFFKKLPSKPQK